MSIKGWLMLTAASGFLAVALGAFGAHGLKERVSPDLLAVWHTAVAYHFYHTLAALLVIVLWQQGAEGRWWPMAAGLFLAGVLVFSGSLYALVLTGTRWLGAITPIGGGLFLAGWVSLGLGAWRGWPLL